MELERRKVRVGFRLFVSSSFLQLTAERWVGSETAGSGGPTRGVRVEASDASGRYDGHSRNRTFRQDDEKRNGKRWMREE